MQRTSIELVCFDIGGVMLRICNDWAQACDIARVPVPSSIRQQTMRHDLRALAHQHETGQIDDKTFDEQAAELTGLTPAHVDIVARAWLRHPYPDVDRLLDRLESAGVPTACLSNTNARHWSMMLGQIPSGARLPVQRLGHRLTSHTIGVLKPDERIFDHAERATGTSGHAILFFDDSADNCQAARQRAWSAYRIDPDRDTVPQMQHHLVQHGVLCHDDAAPAMP